MVKKKEEQTGFDNSYKIAVRDHVRVPKVGIREVRGQIPKSTYQASYL